MSGGTSDDSSVMASVREERPKCMWKPKLDQSTNIRDFQSVVNQAFGLNLGEYISHLKICCCNVAGYYDNPHMKNKILFRFYVLTVSATLAEIK